MSSLRFPRRLETAHLWRPDEDERHTAHRSATNNRDEEGNPNPQRVSQEGDKERDVVCANLGGTRQRTKRFFEWRIGTRDKDRQPQWVALSRRSKVALNCRSVSH